MSFKKDLENRLTKQIEETQTNLENGRKDLDELRSLNTRNATYVVNLLSKWGKEGEKDVKISHRGTLRSAIKKAEEEFKTVNVRQDIQADYFVKVDIGGREYSVEKKFWEQYKQK